MEYYVIAAVLTLLSIVNTVVLTVISHYVKKNNDYETEFRATVKQEICDLKDENKELRDWIQYQKGFTNGRKNK